MGKLSVVWTDGEGNTVNLKFSDELNLDQIKQKMKAMGLAMNAFTVRGTTIYCADNRDNLNTLVEGK